MHDTVWSVWGAESVCVCAETTDKWKWSKRANIVNFHVALPYKQMCNVNLISFLICFLLASSSLPSMCVRQQICSSERS